MGSDQFGLEAEADVQFSSGVAIEPAKGGRRIAIGKVRFELGLDYSWTQLVFLWGCL